MKWLMGNLIILVLLSCSNTQRQNTNRLSPEIPPIVVIDTDTALHLVNGIWWYQNRLFSGYMHRFYATGKLQSTQSFYAGKEEGMLYTFYLNGAKESTRNFHAGEKDGLHQGWWENGCLRFEYHFRNGQYEGDFREWYADGAPFRHIIYQQGMDLSGKGWRQNGKPYMSYVVRNGRRFGLMNAQPCYSLKNEKGEYVTVVKKQSPL